MSSGALDPQNDRRWQPIQVHGTRQMPVWGAIFEEQLVGHEDRAGEARLRTRTLVDYLRSIQEPADR